MRSIEPGISRFRVRTSCARNDELTPSHHPALVLLGLLDQLLAHHHGPPRHHEEPDVFSTIGNVTADLGATAVVDKRTATPGA